MLLNQQVNEQTGKKEKTYYLNINNFKINFPKKLPKFENYDTINENKKLKIFSDFYFPIEFGKITYNELCKKDVIYTEEQAKEILLKKLEQELKQTIPNTQNILNTQVNFNSNESEIEVELVYEVLENIGTNEKILF